ncbi:MAG: GTPase HflX, partial [Microbacterium sp.]
LQTVRDVMGDVGARDLPEIVVINKADLLGEDDRLVLRGLEPNAHFVSSRSGEGIEELRAAVEDALPKPAIEIHAVVPYDRGDLVAAIHETGMLLSAEHGEQGTVVHAHVSARLAAELSPFVR